MFARSGVDTHAQYQRGSRLTATVVGVTSLLVLIGWWLDIAVLKSVQRGRIAMNPTSAIDFILCAIALWNLNCRPSSARSRAVTIACAGAATGVAILGIVSYATHWNLAVDQLLFRRQILADGGSNRMAPNTCLSFVLLGLSLMAANARRLGRAYELGALATMCLALLALVGWAYGVTALYGIASFVPMASHTAVLFLAVSIGLLCARSDAGVMTIVTSQTSGGVVARRLLPAAMLIPLLLGGLRPLEAHLPSFTPQVGFTIVVVGTIVFFSAFVWANASDLYRLDLQRGVAEQGLREQHAVTHAILDSLADGVIVANEVGEFLFFNKAAESILGVGLVPVATADWAATYGVFATDGITPLAADQIPLARAIRGEASNDVELFIRNEAHPRGIYISVTGRPITDERRVHYGGVVMFRDVTQRKEVERLKDEFIGVVSHELRTPLTSIRGSLGLLEGGMVGALSDDALEMVRISRNNADRLIRLINDILDIDKMDAGKYELDRQPLDAEALVTTTMDDLSSVAQEAGVTLHSSVQPNVSLWGDRDRLIQVLTNLISNALKFSPVGGAVRISGGRSTDARVRFSVSDEGAGIPLEQLPKLFARFVQLDSSNARPQGGTGLGLAISKAIVTQHGGDIGVDSTVGKGSTFWFTIPVAP